MSIKGSHLQDGRSGNEKQWNYTKDYKYKGLFIVIVNLFIGITILSEVFFYSEIWFIVV